MDSGVKQLLIYKCIEEEVEDDDDDEEDQEQEEECFVSSNVLPQKHTLLVCILKKRQKCSICLTKHILQ